MLRRPALAFLVVACAAARVPAQLRLPSVIGDGMVLQREAQAPIWGWAGAGDIVRVTPGWAGNAQAATAAADGSWIVRIETPGAGGPHTIAIESGGGSVIVKDVLVGEVWLCSGQSNMEMPVGDHGGGYRGVRNSGQELRAADHPRIRLFNVANSASRAPLSDCRGSWARCSAESVRGFSGTAYFFGRALHQALDVPIGLIESDWGGTPAEAWTSEDGLRDIPDFARAVAALAEARNREAGTGSRRADGVDPHEPGVLYNAMIAPLVPYALRGAIWYQGESNRGRAMQYRTLFPALIEDWRRKFGTGIPFYFVQIAPFEYRDSPANSTLLREAQARALSLRDTGMVVTMDIGNAKDIHPDDKQEVGRRLSLWALARTYGRSGVVCSGPLFREMSVQGAVMRIAFDHVGGGLVSRGGVLVGFEIAGADRVFHPASAAIEGATVVVSSEKVPEPVAVRYACGHAPRASLSNREGLPAAPFRTDDWPLGDASIAASRPAK